jgi:hypothetical protein
MSCEFNFNIYKQFAHACSQMFAFVLNNVISCEMGLKSATNDLCIISINFHFLTNHRQPI